MFFVTASCALSEVKLIHTGVLCISVLFTWQHHHHHHHHSRIWYHPKRNPSFNVGVHDHHHPRQHEGHTGGKPYHRTTGRLMIESFQGKQGFSNTHSLLLVFAYFLFSLFYIFTFLTQRIALAMVVWIEIWMWLK